ncbi:lytic murein transglycosylase [Microbaculum sp. FT89]|uniref:lytic murein transglycosylase n=1 Tax=Microbaculum sp. FT89 TaxID=3447298 RepID=UPI003F52C46A
MRRGSAAAAVVVGLLALVIGGPASAASCHGGASFAQWLDAFRAEAAQQGISQATIKSALSGVQYDQSVVNRDRGQGVFSQSFLEFSDRMVNSYRLQNGAKHLSSKKQMFDRIEQQYGVPGPVLVAFWSLETDFGANNGDFRTLNALASLAYDCRRPDLFREHLMAALQIIDHGDLTAAEMRGAWAGELGQTQFLPKDYMETAVDFDGDGKRNLIKSSADALASSAALLRKHGWRPGEPWLEEVKVPANLPWQEADIALQYPRSEWARFGVTRINGSALPADGLSASLLLPMGKDGPAFLAYPNFQVYLQWNRSLVYATTAAYLATRMAGAPKVSRGSAKPFGRNETIALQKALSARGYHVGKIDGILGANTRAAVKAEQIRLGLPADSYPTAELLQKMR